MYVDAGNFRRIRVHLAAAGSTFIIGTFAGRVVEVSHEGFKDCLDRPEEDVARELREQGALFVDIENDRTEVRLRRGYRSRADRGTPHRKSGGGARKASPPRVPLTGHAIPEGMEFPF